MNMMKGKKSTAAARKRNPAAKNSIMGKSDILIVLAILGGIIFVAINSRLHFYSKTSALSRESQKIQREISVLEREIVYFSTQRESLTSWPHIRKKIMQFKLPLRLPSPAQTYKMTLNYKNNGLDRTEMFAHQTADNTQNGSPFRSELRHVNQ
ncbi:MAG: hypothetical protein PHS31_01240 [Victivallaceae bacterium]|nr:hypothetical protein [Victivallaceae bacterium]MDD4181692.1 hypothetical protein [Victivallaceae bacterium]